jgi:autotransporter-associated beta strand protein
MALSNLLQRIGRPSAAAALLLASSAASWPQVNLLPNGSFERRATTGIPACWTNAYGGTPTVVSGVATRCGDHVLRLVDGSSSSSAGLVSQAVAVAPGASYTAEAYISREATNGTVASLFLKYYDAGGAQAASSSKTSAAAANTWDYVSVAGIAPANAVTAQVLCYSTIASTGTMYFDGVSFRLTPLPPPANQLTRYVSPAGAGAATGLDPSNPAKYNNTAFWAANKASLSTNPVQVIFLEGDYVINTSADRLLLSGIGNDRNQLTLEGQHPFGTVFTRTDAAQTNDAPAMMHLQYATNVVVRHLHWENDTTLSGRLVQYCLAINGSNTGAETRDISVQGCSFVGLSWNIYGAMGFHHAHTHGGQVLNCEFVTGGYSSGFHMIYNAYGAYDLLFENNYFQDCAGGYLRLRGGCHEATVRSNEFVSTSSFYNQPFIQMPTFNNIEPGDETWGYNFKFLGNTFNYLVVGSGQNVAVHFYHSGFDPARAPGLLWNYLLTPAEAAILTSGTVAAKKELVRTNFGINFDTQIVIEGNTRLGYHAYEMKLESTSTSSYNYQDENGVWHICPDYGGDGAWDISDIVTQPALPTTNSWVMNGSSSWDNAANWTPSGVPNGIGSMAILTNNVSPVSRTNTIDNAVTLGKLQLGSLNGLTNFVIEGSRGSTLTMNNGGAGAEIISTTGNASDSINVAVELGDDVTVSNTKTLLIRGVISELGPFSGYGEPRSITKVGAGTLTLANAANSFSGGVRLQSGLLRLGNDSALGTGTLSITNGTLASDSSTARTLTNSVNVYGNFTVGQALGGTGNLTFAGPMNLGSVTRTVTVNNAGADVISGVISGAAEAGLTKAGMGKLTLSGTNTYSGRTTVAAGTLALLAPAGATSLISNTPGIEVSAGATFDVSRIAGGFILGEGQNLSGNGAVTGNVTVASGAVLFPGGSNQVGTLAFNNALSLKGTTLMEIDRANGTNDALRGISTLTYGGTLTVSSLGGTNALGDAYRLFSATTYSVSHFAVTNLPALGSGLRWAWNPANGTLSVVAGTATTPTNISYQVSGSTLTLTWPESHLGWYAQSNSEDVGNPDFWFDVAASQAATNLNITFNPVLTNVFYRLRCP